MKYRPQRGILEDAMAEVVEIEPTMEALQRAVAAQIPLKPGDWVTVKPYTYDARIGWDTHVVTVNGCAVGFTDGPLHTQQIIGSLCEKVLQDEIKNHPTPL